MAYGLADAVALGAKPGVLFWIHLGLIAGIYWQEKGASISTAAAEAAPEGL